ncbi:MAG: peptidase M15 [Alistipes sp.]|jgi:hypothetical protein|nr:peptidase M15 [Alistipes sp.]
MAKHFTIPELVASDTARARGIDNTPPPAARAKLATLANRLLDPVREMWGAPLVVNSGFRCPVLNRAVGGAVGSQHMAGEAADITAGSPAKNRRLFDMIVAAAGRGEIAFDQLIDESGSGARKTPYSWLHISYRAGANRGQILHL